MDGQRAADDIFGPRLYLERDLEWMNEVMVWWLTGGQQPEPGEKQDPSYCAVSIHHRRCQYFLITVVQPSAGRSLLLA